MLKGSINSVDPFIPLGDNLKSSLFHYISFNHSPLVVRVPALNKLAPKAPRY